MIETFNFLDRLWPVWYLQFNLCSLGKLVGLAETMPPMIALLKFEAAKVVQIPPVSSELDLQMLDIHDATEVDSMDSFG